MTGHQLHAQLRAEGVRLALDAQGTLHLPAALAARYQAAIPAHLCYLLVCAAIDTVNTLAQLHSPEHVVIRTEALDAACLAGDVAATRQAAVHYVAAWRAQLHGPRPGEGVS